MHQISGVGWHTLNYLVQSGCTFDEGFTPHMRDVLQSHPRYRKVVEAVQKKWTPFFVKKVSEELHNRRIQVVTLEDTTYPRLLKEIARPPWVIYVRGDVGLLKEASLAMVGTRKPTPYGLATAQMFAKKLSLAGWVVVSGMASGIDGQVHQTVLHEQGKTVAVLGTGVDVVYPKHHRALYTAIATHGAVISEMPPGTKPHRSLFPQRNRIISGLCYGTLVVEAAKRSGALITADFSMEQGREVFAIPGPITSDKSDGTIHLIQQGAKCVANESDILEELTTVIPYRFPS